MRQWRNQAKVRELVREKLGVGRVTAIAFGTRRLICVAGEFPRQGRIAAENSRRRVQLLRYRRFGDARLAVERLYGSELIGSGTGASRTSWPYHWRVASLGWAAPAEIVRTPRWLRSWLLSLPGLGPG